uniref:Putative lipocalin-5 1 n=1 Tax=Amblyomma triste TaxID=251400 RepID=A0A023G959_AMBTT
MILALALCLFVIATKAAANTGVTQPDPLDIMDMVNVDERLAVISRNHTLKTKVDCHSTKKVRGYGTNVYLYNLRGRKNTTVGYEYESGNVNVTLEQIRGTEKYIAKYTVKTGQKTITLLKTDEDKNCFVIFVQNSKDGGCELLVKAPLVTNIPRECQNYFENNCKGEKVQLYKPGCNYENF